MPASWGGSTAFGLLRRNADVTKCAPAWWRPFRARRLSARFATLLGDDWKSRADPLAAPRCEMVTITFPDRDTEKRALAFLLGRFSGRVQRSGEHTVTKEALEALAAHEIPFTIRTQKPQEKLQTKR